MPKGMRRTRRDWLVDAAGFILAFGFGILASTDALPDGIAHDWQIVALGAGLVACFGVFVRKRWPLQFALVTLALAAISPAASGAGAVALFTIAVHRRWPVAVALAVAGCLTMPAYYALYPAPEPFWVVAALGIVVQAAIVGWGMFVRARRELVESLRERAREAEADRDLRVAQAREHERTRIAREMHDVLAHRISLLTLHAGALEFRPDAPPAEVARAAAVIRESARQALEEMRTVITVLRDSPEGADAEPPQPTLDDLTGLIEESRGAGTGVRLIELVESQDELPQATGRTAYRVIQEGLTNARKHAFGSSAQVRLEGAPGRGLTIEVMNPRPLAQIGTPYVIPGSGTGLVGLSERIELAGGRIEHGPTDSGSFRLWAWLPW